MQTSSAGRSSAVGSPREPTAPMPSVGARWGDPRARNGSNLVPHIAAVEAERLSATLRTDARCFGEYEERPRL